LANDTLSELNFIHKHYGNLQEMLEMASFLKYVDLYLTSECGPFYVGHPVFTHLHKQVLEHIFSVIFFIFFYVSALNSFRLLQVVYIFRSVFLRTE
jgi:hypothetical protein